MIFHLTQILAKKIKVSLHPLQDVQKPFLDWTAHLFRVKRIQYIIVTNSASLYSIVMKGRGVKNSDEFVKHTLHSMQELMFHDGCEFMYRKFMAPYTTGTFFATSMDRHVLGSMNELIYHAKFFIEQHRLSVFETSLKINEVPMKQLDYKYPVETFKELIASEKK